MIRWTPLLLTLALFGCRKDSEPAARTTPTEAAQGSTEVVPMPSVATQGEAEARSAPDAPSQEGSNVLETEKQPYSPLSKARFVEIKSLMEQQDDWNPIRIAGVERSDLVKFYVDSLVDDKIAEWPRFAYDKIRRFAESKPTVEQDEKLQSFTHGHGTRASVYTMLMLMTAEQIETVGY